MTSLFSEVHCLKAVVYIFSKLNIKELKEIIKTHDLVLLARKINAPENIIILCSEINPAYTDTRYPEPSKLYGKIDAKKALYKSKEIMKWIKTNL